MNSDRKNKLFNQTVNSSDKSIKINDRLRFIKFLLEETGIQPLLDLGSCFESTEYYQEDVNKFTYNFTEVITKIGGKLKYIKSGTTGHTFQGIFYPDENCLIRAKPSAKEPLQGKTDQE